MSWGAHWRRRTTRASVLVLSGLAIAVGLLVATESWHSSPTRASEPEALERSRLECAPGVAMGAGRALGLMGPEEGAATPEGALEQYISDVAPQVPAESFDVSFGDEDDREFLRTVDGRTTRIVQTAEYEGRWQYTGWIDCGDDR